MKDLAEPVSIPIPEGVQPTHKENGMYCVIVEGSFDDGILAATKVSPAGEYKEEEKEPKEMPKSKAPGKSKKGRTARIKAILGDDY